MIKTTLKKRDKFFLSGFGTFSVVKRKARIGRNPKTGQKVPGWPLENPPPVAGSKSPTPGSAERGLI